MHTDLAWLGSSIAAQLQDATDNETSESGLRRTVHGYGAFCFSVTQFDFSNLAKKEFMMSFDFGNKLCILTSSYPILVLVDILPFSFLILHPAFPRHGRSCS